MSTKPNSSGGSFFDSRLSLTPLLPVPAEDVQAAARAVIRALGDANTLEVGETLAALGITPSSLNRGMFYEGVEGAA